MFISLLAQRNGTKERAPREAALRVRSFAYGKSARNKLASLIQELLVTGFSLDSLTGFQGAPFYVLKFTTLGENQDDF